MRTTRVFLYLVTVVLLIVWVCGMGCYTKKDIDKAYNLGILDGAIYTFENKDSVLPSMWHREMMISFYHDGVDWQNDYWHNTHKFWDSIENKYLKINKTNK